MFSKDAFTVGLLRAMEKICGNMKNNYSEENIKRDSNVNISGKDRV